ncbi:MAG: hypothetical protein J1F22_05430 [Lachnospiraceae bacterium]|nr:hypothetical protein [Lachnospiraceae bacterium]
MRQTEKRNKIKKYIAIIAILLCTGIACYGIFRAPESDQDELEQELLRNEQALAQSDAISQAGATTEAQTSIPATGPAVEEEKSGETITVIGDSVFLGAAPAFQKLQKNVVIDAKISRQVYQAVDVAKKLNKKNKLGDTVILSLGTNGNFNLVTGQELIDYLGTERTIYWINAYGKKLDIQKQVNSNIQKIVKKNDNVHMISWADEGKKHPDWFYQDGIHLNTKGQTGFAKFIQKNIN